MIRSMHALTMAFVLALTLPADAQDISGPHPGLRYAVAGVAGDDVLNVRQYVGTDEQVIGALAPTDTDVVVTGNWMNLDGSIWWQVLLEGSDERGWVNARYLALSDAGYIGETGYPLNCGGTEPFWSLDISGAAATGDDYILGGRTFSASEWQMAHGLRDWFAIYLEENGVNPPSQGSIAVTLNQCSDGMSDTEYSLLATLVLPDGEVYGGCCSRTGR